MGGEEATMYLLGLADQLEEEGDAREVEGVVQALGEVTDIAVLEGLVGVAEEAEADRAAGNLSRVVALEQFTGARTGRALGEQVVQGAVEASGGDGDTGASVHGGGHGEHLGRAEAGLGGDKEEGRVGEEEECPADGALEATAKLALILEVAHGTLAEGLEGEVPLVDDDDDASTDLGQLASELEIDASDALGGVDDKEDNVGGREDLLGSRVREELKGIALGGGTATGSVGQLEEALDALGVAPGEAGADGVAGGAGDLGDDELVGREEAVAERALAHVGAAGEGNTDGIDAVGGRQLGGRPDDLEDAA